MSVMMMRMTLFPVRGEIVEEVGEGVSKQGLQGGFERKHRQNPRGRGRRAGFHPSLHAIPQYHRALDKSWVRYRRLTKSRSVRMQQACGLHGTRGGQRGTRIKGTLTEKLRTRVEQRRSRGGRSLGTRGGTGILAVMWWPGGKTCEWIC